MSINNKNYYKEEMENYIKVKNNPSADYRILAGRREVMLNWNTAYFSQEEKELLKEALDR